MRVCGVRSAGGEVEVFDLSEPGPPGPGQLVLDVTAAGMGRWDLLLHTGGWDVGLRPPAALGVEGVGTVAAVGAGVTEIAIGDVVLAHESSLPGGSGFWAERVLIEATHVARCPAGLDAVVAGALPVPGLTARQALDRLEVQAGTRLLVTGGSGATAGLAVQLGAQAGARVVATAAPRAGGRRHPGVDQPVRATGCRPARHPRGCRRDRDAPPRGQSRRPDRRARRRPAARHRAGRGNDLRGHPVKPPAARPPAHVRSRSGWQHERSGRFCVTSVDG